MATVLVFDSGIGGFSLLGRLRVACPKIDIIYLSDSKYLPYGDLTPDFIKERLLSLLSSFSDIDAVVIACNTATAAAINHLRDNLTIPIVGFEPPIKPAATEAGGGVVGVLATPRTVASERYRLLVERFQSQAKIISVPCPLLAAAIEQGSEGLDQVILSYVGELRASGVSSLALGCTHYELVADRIAKISGLKVHIASTGALLRITTAVPNEGSGKTAILTSGDLENLRKAAGEWLPEIAQDSDFAVLNESALNLASSRSSLRRPVPGVISSVGRAADS